MVQNIHLSGGSLLGVSRGGPGIDEIVDNLQVSDGFSLFDNVDFLLGVEHLKIIEACIECVAGKGN